MGLCASHKNFVGKTPGGLSDKCLLISDPIFHMPGLDHRRLWIGGLPGQGLFLFFFHTCAPFGGFPQKQDAPFLPGYVMGGMTCRGWYRSTEQVTFGTWYMIVGAATMPPATLQV